MIGTLIAKFLKGRWGSILPQVLKAIAEGKMGAPAKAVYWFGAGYRTVTGAALVGIAFGLGSLCDTSGALYPWACTIQPYVITVGGILAGVGLVDGGVRSPWPTGTPKGPDGQPKA